MKEKINLSRIPPKISEEEREKAYKELIGINEFILRGANFDEFVEVEHLTGPTGVTQYFEFELAPATEEELEHYDIVPKTKFLHAGLHQVSVAITRAQIQDLRDQWGIDVLDMSKNVMINEASLMLNKSFLNKVKELANITHKKDFTQFDKVKSILWKTFGQEYEKTVVFKDVKDMFRRILRESQRIISDTRVGPGTYVICNSKTGAALQDMDEYTYAPIVEKPKIEFNGHPYLIGKYANLSVYVDPYMEYDDNRLYIGRKAKIGEVGLGLAIYDEGTALLIIDEAGTSGPKAILKIRFIVYEKGLNPENSFRKIKYKIKDKRWS